MGADNHGDSGDSFQQSEDGAANRYNLFRLAEESETEDMKKMSKKQRHGAKKKILCDSQSRKPMV